MPRREDSGEARLGNIGESVVDQVGFEFLGSAVDKRDSVCPLQVDGSWMLVIDIDRIARERHLPGLHDDIADHERVDRHIEVVAVIADGIVADVGITLTHSAMAFRLRKFTFSSSAKCSLPNSPVAWMSSTT